LEEDAPRENASKMPQEKMLLIWKDSDGTTIRSRSYSFFALPSFSEKRTPNPSMTGKKGMKSKE
jgi:hypothetical protein